MSFRAPRNEKTDTLFRIFMHPPLTTDTHIRTLSEVARGIEKVFSQFRATFWVQAEVGSASERGGHMYGTLVESAGGRQIAKMDFALWQTDLRSIRARFKVSDLSFDLRQGMKACLLCRMEFHAVFGLKLIVLDADPRFVLGELEQRKRELIARLVAEGADALNKRLGVPLLPLRIGLVTSRESAACHDILKTLREGGYGYTVLLADALMQGEQTSSSILAAIDTLERLRPDLVIVARGGGNRTELASLDTERIARRIASCTLPVWTAIGHEIDSGVPDIVSNRAFKTPTALAEEIVARYRREEERTAAAAALLRREWAHSFTRESQLLADDTNGIRQGTRKLADQRRAELLASAETLHAHVARRLAAQLRLLHVARQRAGGELRRHVALAHAGLERRRLSFAAAAAGVLRGEQEREGARLRRLDLPRVLSRIRAEEDAAARTSRQLAARGTQAVAETTRAFTAMARRLRAGAVLERIEGQRRRCDDRMRLVLAHDPRSALKRGYAIVHHAHGGIVTAAQSLHERDLVRIEFHDGSLPAIITRKET